MDNPRKPEHEVNQIFLDRWSPRALSKDVSKEELMKLFEAAKWSPSSSNIQPWKFIYAMNGTPEWKKFFGILVEFNQIWCKNAGALVIIASEKTNDKGEENITHSFDAGAAWMSLALQASMNNLVAHGIAGFDYEKAKEVVNLTDDYEIEAMVAIGRHGALNSIPERMRKGDSLTERRPLKETVFEGKFV